MPLVNLKTVLEHAAAHNYGVGAYNINSISMLKGIIRAAEEQKSPVILAFAEAHFPFMDFELMVVAARCAASRTNVPVVLHLDHGQSIAAIMQAVRYGVSSVMIDASAQIFSENIRAVKDIVRICKPLDISVEAELGCVGGGEGDGSENTVDVSKFTDPVQATEFVQQTGIDALAIAFGNVHGKYKDEPDLNFDLLSRISSDTGIPLVLHGGSGISDADFQRAISLGIRKINFYTKNSLDAQESLQRYIHTNPFQRGEDIARVWNIIEEAYYKNATHNMQMWGSAGNA